MSTYRTAPTARSTTNSHMEPCRFTSPVAPKWAGTWSGKLLQITTRKTTLPKNIRILMIDRKRSNADFSNSSSGILGRFELKIPNYITPYFLFNGYEEFRCGFDLYHHVHLTKSFYETQLTHSILSLLAMPCIPLSKKQCREYTPQV